MSALGDRPSDSKLRCGRALKPALLGACVTLFAAGCGSSASAGLPSSPAKTRFAVAQYVELSVAKSEGFTRDGDGLSTVCSTQSDRSWECSTYFLPANGNVTSVNQDVADTNATYTSGGDIRLRPAKSVAGQGLNSTLPSTNLRKIIKVDGANTGIVPTQETDLTPGESAKQSVSSLSTLKAMLNGSKTSTTPASTGTLGQTTTGEPTDTQATQTNPTDTTGQTETSGSGALGTGTVCGSVTGGRYDFRGEQLSVEAYHGLSCTTALAVIRGLASPQVQNHQGADQSSSYLSYDGWTCPYGSQGTQICRNGSDIITAFAPGAQP